MMTRSDSYALVPIKRLDHVLTQVCGQDDPNAETKEEAC